jgi:hypothetical protein
MQTFGTWRCLLSHRLLPADSTPTAPVDPSFAGSVDFALSPPFTMASTSPSRLPHARTSGGKFRPLSQYQPSFRPSSAAARYQKMLLISFREGGMSGCPAPPSSRKLWPAPTAPPPRTAQLKPHSLFVTSLRDKSLHSFEVQVSPAAGSLTSTSRRPAIRSRLCRDLCFERLIVGTSTGGPLGPTVDVILCLLPVLRLSS